MWNEVRRTPPPNGVTVETKVDDARGVRNIQPLRWDAENKLWWTGGTYVYYTPTHWRFAQ